MEKNYKGYTIKIMTDENAESPREWDIEKQDEAERMVGNTFAL